MVAEIVMFGKVSHLESQSRCSLSLILTGPSFAQWMLWIAESFLSPWMWLLVAMNLKTMKE
jgi:hypothetical protein